MTGYTVHTGSTEKFAAGFDKIFGTPAAHGAKKAASNKGTAKSPKTRAPKKAKKGPKS